MSLIISQSNARLFFEEIKNQSDPFTFLSEIPTPPRNEPFFEEEWIDFKGKPQDDKDAKKIWSKVLSGYANITDGLVIWGIDARKTLPRDIDAACGLRLIPDPHAFESKLRDWIRDTTNPPVTGVEYQSFVNSSGEGFVVCYIPESNYKPHRAEFAEKNYYYRAGDDFLIAEPGLLRTLFYPQTNPYFWVEVDLYYRLHPADLAHGYKKEPSISSFNKIINNKSSISVDVLLHNDGLATAKDTYILFDSNYKLNFDQGIDWFISSHHKSQAALRAKRPIHPGEAVDLFSASFQTDFPNKTIVDSSFEIFPHFEKINFNFTCYADNFRQTSIFVEFYSTDFIFTTGSASKKGYPSS